MLRFGCSGLNPLPFQRSYPSLLLLPPLTLYSIFLPVSFLLLSSALGILLTFHPCFLLSLTAFSCLSSHSVSAASPPLPLLSPVPCTPAAARSDTPLPLPLLLPSLPLALCMPPVEFSPFPLPLPLPHSLHFQGTSPVYSLSLPALSCTPSLSPVHLLSLDTLSLRLSTISPYPLSCTFSRLPHTGSV